MSVTITCDSCGRTADPVWGTFSYSPGGGRHGIEDFHFCYRCVGQMRAVVAKMVKVDPRRWQLFQDAEKSWQAS